MASTEAVAASGPRKVDRALLDKLILASDPGPPLLTALTHRSHLDAGLGYERLEFLGDRVLGLLVADMILRAFPDEAEGAIAKRHTALVRRETLAEIADEIGLGDYIHMSPGEITTGGRENPAILSDVIESVLAVIYQVEGLEVARAFVERYWRSKLTRDPTPPRDAKTSLQEWLQGRGAPLPSYVVAERTGPDHAPRFLIRVKAGPYGAAEGEGGSKREAEQAAAANLLSQLGAA